MNKIDLNNISISISMARYWSLSDMWRPHREHGWFWRFYYNDAAGAGIRIDKQEIELTPQNYYMVPPGVEFFTWQNNSPRQFYIHFEATQPYTRASQSCYSFPADPQILEYINNIDRELRPGPDFVSPAGGMLCVALCSLAVSKIPESDLTLEISHPVAIKTAHQMKDNPQREFTVKELAGKAGMCPDSFIRMFKENIGTTPYQYLMSLRIEKAAFLLENSYLPIDEISQETGFKDRFHFSRIFKNRTGTAPGAYRKLRQI